MELYEVRELLGSGSFGTTHRCVQNGNEYVVKRVAFSATMLPEKKKDIFYEVYTHNTCTRAQHACT